METEYRGNASLPRIAIDVMGSDYGPQEFLKGVLQALQKGTNKFGKLLLVGDEAIIQKWIVDNRLSNHPVIEVVPSSQVIEMDEKPMSTLKQKKESSMYMAIDLVKAGKADAVLSCGNTGCLMAGGTLKLRTLPGVERPALASVIPTRKQHFVLIDVGANPSSTAKHIVHNAILGSHYANAVLGKARPRVGLLTIGTEEGKGNELIHEAHRYLKELNCIQYQGLIEGFHVFQNAVDVVVCDGFVGNILLKTCESLFDNLKQYLKDEFKKNNIRKLGAFLSRGVFVNMKKHFAQERFSGAPLLGLNGWVFKSHGSSKAASIVGALNICSQCLRLFNLQTVLSDVAQANVIIEKCSKEGN